MATKTSNWTKFKWPYEPLDRFTRSEPFPSDELKATYVGSDKRPGASAKTGFSALKKRWNQAR